MELIERIKAARDRAVEEGYVATAQALDDLLNNEALFALPEGQDSSKDEPT
ncbi:MAG: hypothetical protein ABJ370_06565 [Paracoccaceae bacterium]